MEREPPALHGLEVRRGRPRRGRRTVARKRAVRVIEGAVLHAMYRPGGWRLGAVLAHWRRLAAAPGGAARRPAPPTGTDMV